MTDPRDELDAWLQAEVEPLGPPPGTFDRIQRQARRRKRHQAVGASAAAAVVVAAAALAPTVGAGLLAGHHGNGPAPAPAAAGTRSVSVSAGPASRSPAPAASAPSVAASGTGLPATGTGLGDTTPQSNPAPANFQPTSITMIGATTGAVIGQAGTAGHCLGPVPADCTSLAGTGDYGASWYGVSAPVVGAPAGSTGTSQLRFLNARDGWAFGPELYETSQSGRQWQPVETFGLRVTDLEAAGDRAFAVLASCQGTGPMWAADCSTFSLWTLAPGRQQPAQVQLNLPAGQAATALGTAGRAASASLVIAGAAGHPAAGTGYLLTPSGAVVKGSVGGGAWTYAGQAPCRPGPAAASGAPRRAQLTAGQGTLLLNCASPTTTATQAKQLWQSADGAHWTKVSQPPAPGRATALASAAAGQAVLATTAGLDYSADRTTWQPAVVTSPPPGGFSYVGMTTATQGVALPADPALGEVFTTATGGQSWTPHPIDG